MKKMLLLFLVAIGLSGCSGSEDAIVSYTPHIVILYSDGTGFVEMKEMDKEKIDDSDKNNLEIISITDEKGDTVQCTVRNFRKIGQTVMISLNISEAFSPQKKETKREYTIKYKVPFLLGHDQIEEIKLYYTTRLRGDFSQILYNNIDIRCVTTDSWEDPTRNPTEEEIAELDAKTDELLFSGDTVASLSESRVVLIVPVEAK
ncbi:hypothetical protein M2480_000387 [Parabacteroides sp. PFB2-12]|uniref:hypothetical protein n=1 Tax=unclassified Parabacteroides TaxID=2649774 RepID=UPI0024736726|nr:MULTISPECIES: hypothetical protein [unclassified Parabacteroides]MDH6341237.1 hypothetical protein [Parabacteroides sp. PM6-13]MDH6389427.1 hypothetical protein [Parabacteroides sp. PFB2-12]